MTIENQIRKELRNPELTRPDWNKDTTRPDGPLWLDKNENMDPEYDRIVAGWIREVDPRALYTYPELAPLYAKLSQWVGVSPRQLLLTPGSDGAIRYAFDGFVSPGDTVIHSSPTFAMYPVYSKIFGARALSLVYTATEAGPTLDFGLILKTIKNERAKLFCLPNPDSPTGSILTQNQLREIIETAAAVNTAVLIDEAYHPFLTDSVATWTESYQNLIVVRTFSKAWGLAGARVGYVVAHPVVIEKMHKSRPMYEIGALSAALIQKALDHPDEMQKSVARLEAGKKFFVSEMKKLGLKTITAHGNFFHVAFGGYAADVHAVLKGKVLYRPDFAEPCLKGFSRFSCTSVEAFSPVVEAIRRVIQK